MRLSYATKRKLLGFTFLIPYLLGFLMFFAVPLGQTIFYSFQKIDVPDGGGMSFTFLGLQNYVNLFTTELSTDFLFCLFMFLFVLFLLKVWRDVITF